MMTSVITVTSEESLPHASAGSDHREFISQTNHHKPHSAIYKDLHGRAMTMAVA